MKIEYDLLEILHFVILITCIILKNCDFYNNIIIKSNQCFFSSNILHTYKF